MQIASNVVCYFEDDFTCVQLRHAASVLLGSAEGEVLVTLALHTKPDMLNTTPAGRIWFLTTCEMGHGNKQRCT